MNTTTKRGGVHTHDAGTNNWAGAGPNATPIGEHLESTTVPATGVWRQDPALKTIRHPEAVQRAEAWVARQIGTVAPSDGSGLIRLSGPLEHDNIVNGYGLRAVLWTQGCPNHCPGCQNPETWDFEAGLLVPIDEVKDRLRAFRGQAGLTFCGGEPFVQPRACKEIADWARAELGWNIWSFSGFTYDLIKAEGGAKWEFLQSLDALIDGPFVLEERDLTMKFRGSRNQRLLHLQRGTGAIINIE